MYSNTEGKGLLIVRKQKARKQETMPDSRSDGLRLAGTLAL